ncbi:helix-turn-helix domain-containing protein [Legionella worsleiensis]|uniref:Helix-turn-helix protein n=1 Tax=Legionella worsleiensis TaxID=45076 RepID=A0A0W1AKT3_9GAMM|nr:helix-turn-helix transcriptional regulator [Legionella worsleiensis]KTD81929.1 helix-turn-helix protein [Legionella worsleiensis]STY31270.1 Helix-turn-helix [Legionella worsleiensis]
MITSEKQYKESLKKIEMLALSLSSPKKSNIPPIIEKAGRAQICELIDNIKKDIEEFEKYKNIDISKLEIHSLDDLMKTPIRYRLAAGMSVDVFAQLVGVSPRQINRYEKECYQNSHSSTLKTILQKLEVDIDGKISVGENNRTSKVSSSSFPSAQC